MGVEFARFAGVFRRGEPCTPFPRKGDVIVTVRLRGTGAAIPRAKVTLVGAGAPGDTLVTDARGTARWTARNVGKYLVKVAFDGQDASSYELPEMATLSVPEQPSARVWVDPVDRKLRLVLIDGDERPIADRGWACLAPVAQTGRTGANGLIELALAAGQASARIEVVRPVPHRAPLPEPGDALPCYPPAIEAADFVDRDERPAVPTADQATVGWDLTIVDPGNPRWNSGRSLKHRLRNLGFAVDGDSDDAVTRAAVEAYQRHYQGEQGRGLLADIKDDLKNRHDGP